ncbi:MAG: hypothetical protein LC687_03855, partial [Actinobacteria bacterium]|nr:hypothetical protein [Actinomycetota bacterium]
TLPTPTYPLYGVELQIQRFTQNIDGSMQAITSKVFVQCTLELTTNTRSRPTSATAQIISIPEIHPVTGESNDREYLLDVDNIARVSTGTNSLFLQYNTQSDEWSYMIGYEGWVQEVNWGRLHVDEISYQDTLINAPFTAESFTRWKERAAHEFSSAALTQDEIQIYGEIESQLPSTITIPNEEESKKLPLLTPGDEIRGPGLPINTVITEVAQDFFKVSDNALQFGIAEFTVLLRRSRVVQETRLDDFKSRLYDMHSGVDSSIYTAMWPSTKWPKVSGAYLEGLKDAALFQPLAVEKVTDNPAAIEFDKVVFLEVSLDRVLRHINSVGFKMGPQHASLMDKA